jgi:hypothetical protein
MNQFRLDIRYGQNWGQMRLYKKDFLVTFNARTVSILLRKKFVTIFLDGILRRLRFVVKF